MPAQIFTVHPLQFLKIHLGRRGLNTIEIEAIDQFLTVEDFLFIPGRPPEENQEVEQCTGQVPLVAEVTDKGIAIPFRVWLSLCIGYHRQMGELRHGGIQGLVQGNMPIGVLHMVIPADNMTDIHRYIVDHVREMEDRRPIGADDDKVLHVFGLLAQGPLDLVNKG